MFKLPMHFNAKEVEEDGCRVVQLYYKWLYIDSFDSWAELFKKQWEWDYPWDEMN